MTYLAAILVALSFAAAFRLLGLVPLAATAVATASAAAGTLRDPALNEAAKERAVRQASLRLMGHFLSMVGRALLAVGLSLLPLAALNLLGLASWGAVTHLLATWQGIALASITMALAAAVKGRR